MQDKDQRYVIPSKDWFSPKIEFKKSRVHGQGMFAVSPITIGETVVVWGGEGYTDSKGAQSAAAQGRLVMQWDEDLFSVETRGDDPTYFVNHSCDPNLWMRDAFTLVARRAIQPGEEITADYALWEANEDYVSSWECHCGSPSCPHRITGEDCRMSELQSRYAEHFSPLIKKRIQKVRDGSQK